MSFESREEIEGNLQAGSTPKSEYSGGYAVNARGEVILTDKKAEVSEQASEERSA